MAEYFLKQQYPHLKIESAGLAAMVGRQADEKAIACMQHLDIVLVMVNHRFEDQM